VRLGRRLSEKIDRLIPIVAESEQIVDRRIKSANLIGETVLRRALKKFALLNQHVTIALNNRVGVRETRSNTLPQRQSDWHRQSRPERISQSWGKMIFAIVGQDDHVSRFTAGPPFMGGGKRIYQGIAIDDPCPAIDGEMWFGRTAEKANDFKSAFLTA